MQYNIEKRVNEEEEEDEEEDYTTFGPRPKKEESQDPMLSKSLSRFERLISIPGVAMFQ